MARSLRIVLLLIVAFAPAEAEIAVAGGFANDLQSASAAAVAGAGAAASGDDASTIFYNPAGMTRLAAPQLVVAAGVSLPVTSFRNAGTHDAAGGAVRGSSTIPDEALVLPSIFAALPIGQRWWIGLGVYSPFGQAVRYDEGWVGRYDTTKTSLTTIEVKPAIAYRATDWLSLGAGLGAQYARFARDNAVDFGALCLGSALAASCPALSLTPQAADGSARLDLDDWALAYDLGITIRPSPGTILGITYRGETNHSLSGSASFGVPAKAQVLTNGGSVFQSTGATTHLTMPDSITLGLSQQLSEHVTLLAGASWTHWSRMKELTVAFANPAQPAVTQRFDWKDSYSVSLGAVYRLSDATRLRGGIAFDQSPVTNAFRSADLPQNDRATVALGIEHRLGDKIVVVLSYDYDRELDAPVAFTVPGQETLVGTFHRQAHTFGLQANVSF